METKLEALDANQVKITITVEADEIARRVKREYKRTAHRYNFPGFRKGKAPRPVIDNAMGEEFVRATVTDDMVNELYPRAFDELRIYPIGKPDFGDPELVAEGEDFTFSFTVDIVPDADLSSFEPVDIELPNGDATEAEIEEQIEMLQEHYFTYADAAEGEPIAEDSRVTLDIKTVDENGEEIESVSSEDFPYTLGSALMPEGFDEQLIGMKAGETKSFEIQLPETPTAYMYDANGGGTATFTLTVKTVKTKQKPELTDEWASETLGFEGVEDLRTRIAESISHEKSEMIPRMREIQCLRALVDRVQAEAPESMVNDTETRLLQDFFTQLQKQGATLDAYLMQNDLTADQFKEDIKKQATEMTKEDMALDAWAKHFGLEASDEELLAEFEEAGAEDPKALFDEWVENGRIYLIRSGVLRQKALQAIMDGANVSEYDIRMAAEEAEEADEAEDEPKGKHAAE